MKKYVRAAYRPSEYSDAYITWVNTYEAILKEKFKPYLDPENDYRPITIQGRKDSKNSLLVHVDIGFDVNSLYCISRRNGKIEFISNYGKSIDKVTTLEQANRFESALKLIIAILEFDWNSFLDDAYEELPNE